MKFRIFKENGLNTDERYVLALADAAAVYREYFANGYSVRIVEVETGVEYAMRDERLVPVPYTQRASDNWKSKGLWCNSK